MTRRFEETQERKAIRAFLKEELEPLFRKIAAMPRFNPQLAERYGEAAYETYDDYGTEWQMWNNVANNRFKTHCDTHEDEYPEWRSSSARKNFVRTEIQQIVDETREQVVAENNVDAQSFQQNFQLAVDRNREFNRVNSLESIETHCRRETAKVLGQIVAQHDTAQIEFLSEAYDRALEFSREKLRGHFSRFHTDQGLVVDDGAISEQRETFVKETIRKVQDSTLDDFIAQAKPSDSKPIAAQTLREKFGQLRAAMDANAAAANVQLTGLLLKGPLKPKDTGRGEEP